MPKRSKKSKSKRITLKQKHKVIRKVKEHHKKKAKEAKKLGLNRKGRVEKDPGIPNDWPFKEQELKALEARRSLAIEELEKKKAARKERARKRKLGILDDDDTQDLTGEDKVNDTIATVGKKRDTSDRAFYKELAKVIELSDVILEVIDARDPLGTRCIDMEKMVMKAGPDKRLLLVLNKIDLVPREAVEKWLKYLREELPAVAFKCSTQEQRSNLGWKSSKSSNSARTASKPSNLLQTSDCLGAETLIKLLKNYSRSHEIKKSITVGVIGLPNVGKRSLINSLKRSHVVNVGATPGLTRSMQEVHLDKNVKLLDCPGVVMLKSSENDSSIALLNCKKIEKLDDPISPVKEILKLCPASMLATIYKVPTFESVDDFLQKVASVRGKIPYYTMPPKRNQELPSEARIVSELGKEFNIDEAYSSDTSFIEVRQKAKKGMALLTAEFDKINNNRAKKGMAVLTAEFDKINNNQVRSYSRVAHHKVQYIPVNHATTSFHANWSPEAGYNFGMACYYLIKWQWIGTSRFQFAESRTWVQTVQSLGTSPEIIANNPFAATLLGTKDPKSLKRSASLLFFFRNVLVHHKHQGGKATSLIEQEFHRMFPRFLPDLIDSVGRSLLRSSPCIAFNQLTGFNVDRLFRRSDFK